MYVRFTNILPLFSFPTRPAERTDRAIAAERVANDLRSKMRQLELDMAGSERSTFDITAEMTRQYKAMQENLMARVTGLEDAAHRLQDDLGASRGARACFPCLCLRAHLLTPLCILRAAGSRALLEETRHEKNAIIARRDEEIERLKVKLEDMAAEFGDMLAETLRKMGERVELAASSWEGEAAAGVPIIRRSE